MKTISLISALLACLCMATSAIGKPDHADRRAAKQQCSSERGKTKATREAFRAEYGSRARCIRENAAEEEAEGETAHKNAAKECKAERNDPSFADRHEGETFEEFYGDNKNGKNAYGKCVSSKATAQKDEMDAEDAEEARDQKNAAKRCAAERRKIGDEAFAKQYGTNPNRRNAFGKCVSSKTEEATS
jgi:hypothetical protein